MFAARRLPIAFATLVIWTAITLVGARLSHAPGTSLVDTVTKGVEPHLAAAVLFLAAVVFACRWRDMALRRPIPGSLGVLLFPMLYLVLFAGLATVLGWPAPKTLFFVAANTLLVGISEELMFRGVLYRALLTRVPVWPAILVTSLLFGSVHVLNGFITGKFGEAAVQALAAGPTGLAMMAIMIRTGSILVAMAYHATWDFLTFAASASQSAGLMENAATAGSWRAVLLPVVLVLPNAAYGLYLLRHAGRPAPPA
jgi:hypothetical protein